VASLAKGTGLGRAPWLPRRPRATRDFFRDGYFYPGDVGLFGPDGRLSLRGRVSEVVNVLGLKIATGGIEQALQGDRRALKEQLLASADPAARGRES